jgi:hypothetical protein
VGSFAARFSALSKTVTKEDTMTEEGTKHSERDDAEARADEVGDLDVPDDADVSGGALNAYLTPVQGEKQGRP